MLNVTLSSSMTKRSHFFQTEIILRISSTDTFSHDIIILLFETYLVNLCLTPWKNFLSQRVPYVVIHWFAVFVETIHPS